MTYTVAEIFLTIQGEGYWSGRVAVFCRFSKCNLWSGEEEYRHKALCKFCDTDFSEKYRYESVHHLVDEINSLWPVSDRHVAERMVVLTGGEPLLQTDEKLLIELHNRGFYIAVETNGTKIVPEGIDWVCVSPKHGTVLRATGADEIKVVYPQKGLDMEGLSNFPAKYHWVSPMDVRNLPREVPHGGSSTEENVRAAIEYCLRNPLWRLSVQTHKYIGVR